MPACSGREKQNNAVWTNRRRYWHCGPSTTKAINDRLVTPKILNLNDNNVSRLHTAIPLLLFLFLFRIHLAMWPSWGDRKLQAKTLRSPSLSLSLWAQSKYCACEISDSKIHKKLSNIVAIITQYCRFLFIQIFLLFLWWVCKRAVHPSPYRQVCKSRNWRLPIEPINRMVNGQKFYWSNKQGEEQ